MEITKKETEKFVVNDQQKSNFEFAIQMNRWLLQPLGLWPLSLKGTRIEKFLSRISVILCIFFLLFLTIPGCLEILLIKDLETVLNKIGPLSFNIKNAINYFLLLIHQEKISVCLEMMYDDWRNANNQDDQAVMLKSVYTARNFISICAIFMFAGGLPFCTIVPLLENSASSENYTIKNLAFSGDFVVFDPQVRPFYDAVFFLQFVATFATCLLTCGICSITILFVMHIVGQLEIVMKLLHNLVDKEAVDKKMAFILQRHLRSLRFAAQLEKIMNEICLVEFLSSTFGICLLGFYIMTVLKEELKNHRSVQKFFNCFFVSIEFFQELESNDMLEMTTHWMLFSSYIFNIFIYCYISELLLSQCEKVGKVAYMIEWNCLPVKKARDLILIIIISFRPSKLTGGKMISFSIQCFCSILKASLAYLNMIRTFLK